jgi:hypothetical protein
MQQLISNYRTTFLFRGIRVSWESWSGRQP